MSIGIVSEIRGWFGCGFLDFASRRSLCRYMEDMDRCGFVVKIVVCRCVSFGSDLLFLSWFCL